MSATRGQVKRALIWERYLRVHRLKRRDRDAPGCVTCGARPNHFMARGEPGYSCRHPALWIDDSTMARARAGFR